MNDLIAEMVKVRRWSWSIRLRTQPDEHGISLSLQPGWTYGAFGSRARAEKKARRVLRRVIAQRERRADPIEVLA
jgi:hypothetical protein